MEQCEVGGAVGDVLGVESVLVHVVYSRFVVGLWVC